MDRIDGKHILLVCVRQDCLGVLMHTIGAKRHVATKTGLFEVRIRKVEVGSQRAKPLASWKCPEREGVSVGLGRFAVVNCLVGGQKGDAAQ